MLIERIQARDFMRFRSLDLRNLPLHGSVAVVGPNESGKSAIGEAICFALFGATPRASVERAHRVIRWGAPSVRVELNFQIPGRGRYTVVREMDREGGRHVRLKAAGTDVVIAEGLDEVGKELYHLLGFRFQEFRYSFYLAQNELDILDVGQESGTRRVIYKMLGIDVLQRASRRVKAELETLQKSFREDRQELRLCQALLESSGFDPAEAEALDEEITRLKEEEEGRMRLVEEEKESLRLHEQAHKILVQLLQSLTALRRAVRFRFLEGALESLAETLGGHLKARRKERDEIEAQRVAARERLAEASSFAEALGRLVDLARSRAARLRQDLTEGAGAEEDAVSRVEELQEARARLAADRRQRWTASIQFLLALAVAVLGGVAAWGFHTDAAFMAPLAEVLAKTWRMPAALGGGGFFLLLAVLALVRILVTGRSLHHNRRFRNRLEIEVKALQREAGALKDLLQNRAGGLKSALPFLLDEDLQQQGKRLLDEFPSRISAGAGEEELARVLDEKREAVAEVETLEARRRRRAELTSLLERRTADLFEGRPDTLARAEAVEPLPPQEDVETLETEIDALVDHAQEVRNLLISAEKERGETHELDPLWQDIENLSGDLRGKLEQVMGHLGAPDLDRLKTFLSDIDLRRLPSDFSSALEEEFGRVRSAFPAEEEMVRRREKVLYDLEQETAKQASLSARIEGLEREAKRLAPRLEKHRELEKKVELLSSRVGPLEHDIAVRRALIDLFAGTVTNVKNRFGPAIGRFVGTILPRVTRERYGKVQVSADLDISVFSRERNDYAGLEEISGGTRDQVLLCLRLALAQALLQARMGEDRKQFLFLDEPISSFDEERSLLFLELIKDFNDTFQQNFVTIHMVNAAPQAWKGVIHTSIEEDRLDVDLEDEPA